MTTKTQTGLSLTTVDYKEGRGKNAIVKYSAFALKLDGEVILEASRLETITACLSSWKEREGKCLIE